MIYLADLVEFPPVLVQEKVLPGCPGCPGTQWDVIVQPVKTRPKFHCQNKSYVRYKLVAYFSNLVGQNFRGMVYTAQNWKTKAVLKMACKMDQ